MQGEGIRVGGRREEMGGDGRRGEERGGYNRIGY